MARAALALVALALLAATATAQVDYTLSPECKADPGADCCPGFRMLINMFKDDGCDARDFIDSDLTSPELASMCKSECGQKIDKLASLLKGKTGKGCPWVQRVLAPFPWFCSIDTDENNRCGSWLWAAQGVAEQAAAAGASAGADMPIFTQSQMDTMCSPCAASAVEQLSGNKYNLYMGDVPTDKPEEALPFGDITDQLCVNIDDSYCVAEYPSTLAHASALEAAMGSASLTLEDLDGAPFKAACSGCARATLGGIISNTNPLGEPSQLPENPSPADLAEEAAKQSALVVLQHSCHAVDDSGDTCWDRYQANVDGATRNVFATWLGSCAGLADLNPQCTPDCQGLLKTLKETLGCCWRLPFELLAAGNPGATLGAADINTAADIIDATSAACQVDLGDSCNSGNAMFQASTDLGNFNFEALDPISQMFAKILFVKDLAGATGASRGSFAVTGSRDGSILEWVAKGETDAATAQIADAYKSLVAAGGFNLSAVKAVFGSAGAGEAERTCGTSPLQDVHFIPAVGATMTTNCQALSQVADVDCTQADYSDEFGNDFWIIAKGPLSSKFESCD